MKTRRLLMIAIPVVVLFAAVWLVAAVIYFNRLPQHVSQHETLLVGQSVFVPGSQAAVRVLVRDTKDSAPLQGATITVAFKPAAGGKAQEVYRGLTDAGGTADVHFRVPDTADPNQLLIVETRSALGSDEIERAVKVQRDFRILLTTDKPLYQPGQVIHIRALALSTFDLFPAQGATIEVTIADGKDNKVFRKQLATDDFGAAWVDFTLASQVNAGPYKITAALGNTTSEKTVTVEHYVLPKFKVTLQTERAYYQPGERVRGTLDAQYFFGKPVDGGVVWLEGYTFDVERSVFFTLEGRTETDGSYAFEFDLPTYIAGSDLEGGLGRIYLQAVVMDLANHTETNTLSLPVSASGLVIEAIPEAGIILPGVENIIYILTSYPDGSPARSNLEINISTSGQRLDLETGEYGVAELRLTPNENWMEMSISARAENGAWAEQYFQFQGVYGGSTVLLRPEKPVYRVGEAMKLELFTSTLDGTVYLDIVREGQTLSTRAVEMNAGRGEVVVDLTPDLFGTLELHAYRVLTTGTIIRDTRLVVVDQAQDLNVALSPGQATYLPGDTASLLVQTSGQDGSPVRAAVGLAVVDESVFALAEQDPGFAKLYFMLESELLQPKYDLHGFSVPDLLSGIPDDDPNLQLAVRSAAQASLASSVQGDMTGSGASIFGLRANSHDDALRRITNQQQSFFNSLSKGLFAAFILFPAAVLGLAGVNLWQKKVLWKSLLTVAALFGWCLALVMVYPLGEMGKWARSPLDRLSYIFSSVGEWLLIPAGIFILGGFIAWIVLLSDSIRRKEMLLTWLYGVLPAALTLLPVWVYASLRAGGTPDTALVIATLVGALAVPLALLAVACGFAWQKRGWAALGALLVSGFMLTAPVALTVVLASFGGVGVGAASPQMLEEVMVEREVMDFAGIPPAMPTQAAGAVVNDVKVQQGGESTTAAQPPRLRQYFPETMFWLPDGATDENGALQLQIPVADSITTWRITALASSQDGRLGSATAPLRVFQDFFIDLDLPLSLTVGDEISIPVGVFNYLAEDQTVRLEAEPGAGFTLLDDPVKEISIASNEINVVYFKVRAEQFGMQPFQVTAYGTKMSDAIRKEVRVFPNGKLIQRASSDWLLTGASVQIPVEIPTDAIPGTQSILVKIYPGMLSQVVEGLDSILRMPYGCFEQISSTTYPNLLVMDYLKTTGQTSPEVQMKAEEYINLGYQRLLTFEVGSSGGFSLFGEEPADRMLTAYGLMEFSDMRRVHEVDERILDRAARFLFSQQADDGSWENDRGLVHENTWQSLGNDKLPVTAYIAWALVQAGYADEPQTQKALAYIGEHLSAADDSYVLAMVANALVAADLEKDGQISSVTEQVLDELAAAAQTEGNIAYWKSGVATFMGSEGKTGSIETTAMAVYAFIRANVHIDLVNAGLTFLIQQKDSFGTWNSTQATVLTLKALIANVRAGAENIDAQVTLSLNGGQVKNLSVTPENFDVVQMVSFDDVNPGAQNLVRLEAAGTGKLMYQVVSAFTLPWEKLADYPDLLPQEELLDIEVTYDRTELAVDDTVTVHVKITLREGQAESGLIDLGVPPGFEVLTEDLQALVDRFRDVPSDYPFATVQRFELTPRQVLIYVMNLQAGQPLEFNYRLRARFPLQVQVPASNAYDYYNPDVNGEVAPVELVVNP